MIAVSRLCTGLRFWKRERVDSAKNYCAALGMCMGAILVLPFKVSAPVLRQCNVVRLQADSVDRVEGDVTLKIIDSRIAGVCGSLHLIVPDKPSLN